MHTSVVFKARYLENIKQLEYILQIFFSKFVVFSTCFVEIMCYLLIFFCIFAEDNCIDVGTAHTVNVDDHVSGSGVRTETMGNSMGDEALTNETNITVFKSEKETETTASESSVKCEYEKAVAADMVTHEVSVAEYKPEEDVTSESSECEVNVADCAVKEEDSDTEKETKDEHVISGVDTTVKYDSKNNQDVSESRDSVKRSDDLKNDSYSVSDIRPVGSDVETLHRCETEVAAEINSVGSNVRNSEIQDLDLVQEMTVNDADHMTYEPNMVPEHDLIHESAVLDSTGYILKDGNVVQDNSNSKDGDTKTAVDVSGEVGSVLVNEDEDAEEVQAALIAAVAGSEGCCWDVVDSTEKLLAEVPLVALEAVPVPVAVPVTLAVVEEGEAVEEVEVIPMQEELEVRLEEGTFPVAPEDALSMDWPYPMKMDSAIVAAALIDPGDGTSSAVKSTQAQYPEYSTSQAVKLELEG